YRAFEGDHREGSRHRIVLAKDPARAPARAVLFLYLTRPGGCDFRDGGWASFPLGVKKPPWICDSSNKSHHRGRYERTEIRLVPATSSQSVWAATRRYQRVLSPVQILCPEAPWRALLQLIRGESLPPLP